mmetsp:Transcript_4715/g.12929  ORF Transcript_4715/g.12929 Transcript_4715/m.12929 type:complete len:122 (-) Transcript_4715:691-1056(-)|eukprot:431638-Pelagomonas_calceolata.AAC.1
MHVCVCVLSCNNDAAARCSCLLRLLPRNKDAYAELPRYNVAYTEATPASMPKGPATRLQEHLPPCKHATCHDMPPAATDATFQMPPASMPSRLLMCVGYRSLIARAAGRASCPDVKERSAP